MAQQPQRYSHKQLHLMMACAGNAADYQQLATYFHRQELMFRAKAQHTIDEYSSQAGKFTMATKFTSRAEVASRLYESYSFKAVENARLAGWYDEMLTGLGIKPVSESAAIVSVKDLQNESNPVGLALMETPRRAGGESSFKPGLEFQASHDDPAASQKQCSK
jgi:hypothetical protein